MLIVGAQEIDKEGKPVAPRPLSALELLADLPNSSSSFGHASLSASDTDSALELGTDGVPGGNLRYADGAPSLELKDSKEAVRFRAP